MSTLARPAPDQRSRWWRELPAEEQVPRPPLPGDTEADVAIVGAGYTGLWTAYYLGVLAPDLRVVLVEADQAGAGASGRNGGWCTAEATRLLGTLIKRHGPMPAMRMFRAAGKTMAELERVFTTEGIDCHWQRDGSLYVARTEPHRTRLLEWQHNLARLGIEDLELFDGPAARDRLDLAGIRAAAFTPHCAVVQPARIARGLANLVAGRGVLIAERTRALSVRPGHVRTDHGTVRARAVITATEGYSAGLPGATRDILPVHSYAIATEPLAPDVWAGLGWHDRVTVTDSRYHFAYLQRTADDRMVVGGRGAGYRFGSRAAASASQDERAHRRLFAALTEFFPSLSGVRISDRWSGVYGLHRDAEPSVRFDPATGLGSAGGYGGEGIVLSNLAGRTLAALIAGVNRPETKLCWVGRVPRGWEPEPVRYAGVRAASALARVADGYEERVGRVAPLAGRILGTLT